MYLLLFEGKLIHFKLIVKCRQIMRVLCEAKLLSKLCIIRPFRLPVARERVYGSCEVLRSSVFFKHIQFSSGFFSHDKSNTAAVE